MFAPTAAKGDGEGFGDPNGLEDPEEFPNAAKGDLELPDIAPNLEFANIVLLEAPPNRDIVLAATVANGDLAEVLAKPLPGGIYIYIYVQLPVVSYLNLFKKHCINVGSTFAGSGVEGFLRSIGVPCLLNPLVLDEC